MSEGKKARLTAECAGIPQGPPTEPKPPLDKPRPVRPQTQEEMRRSALYGVIEGLPLPRWLHAVDYKCGNEWLGDKNIVYAGSLQTDPSQGVVFLATRHAGPVPEELGRYLTSQKDGALRVESANGPDLTLVAANGAKYRFNIDDRQLVRITR